MSQVKETLEAALKLFDTYGWTQGNYAKDTNGTPVPTSSKDAACFCTKGAVLRVVFTPEASPKDLIPWEDARRDKLAEAMNALSEALPVGFGSVPIFNDDCDTTLDLVKALYRQAIENVTP